VQKDPAAAFAKIEAARHADEHDTAHPAHHSPPATDEEDASPATVSEETRQGAVRQRICPPCGMDLSAIEEPCRVEIEGHTFYLCGPGCAEAVKKDPAAAMAKIAAAQNAAPGQQP
jgi:YHS domain-containing protein